MKVKELKEILATLQDTDEVIIAVDDVCYDGGWREINPSTYKNSQGVQVLTLGAGDYCSDEIEAYFEDDSVH